MTFQIPQLKDLQNESDVEQKMLYPLLVAEMPFGFGIPQGYIQTKANIRRFQIGKGTESKLYFPDYLMTEQQTAFSAAQDKRAQEFTAAQTERQEKSANTAAEFQMQFTAGQSDRQEKYNTLIADHTKFLTEQDAFTKEKLAASLKQSEENLAELKAKYEQLAKAKLDEIDAHKSKVEKLV